MPSMDGYTAMARLRASLAAGSRSSSRAVPTRLRAASEGMGAGSRDQAVSPLLGKPGSSRWSGVARVSTRLGDYPNAGSSREVLARRSRTNDEWAPPGEVLVSMGAITQES